MKNNSMTKTSMITSPMLDGVIYVANPYTGTSFERNQRFLAVEKYTAHLIREGKTAISPIVRETAKVPFGCTAEEHRRFAETYILLI